MGFSGNRLIRQSQNEKARQLRYGNLLRPGLLKAEDLLVNKKRYIPRKGCKCAPRSCSVRRLPMEVPSVANQHRSMEVVANQLSNGCRFSVLHVLDDYLREIVGQLVLTFTSGQPVARFVDQLADSCSVPPMIVRDNGPGFTGKAMSFWAKVCNVWRGFIQPGRPT